MASRQRIFLIMAIAPTATDMPQNELYENDNLEAAKAERGGRLTTGSSDLLRYNS